MHQLMIQSLYFHKQTKNGMIVHILVLSMIPRMVCNQFSLERFWKQLLELELLQVLQPIYVKDHQEVHHQIQTANLEVHQHHQIIMAPHQLHQMDKMVHPLHQMDKLSQIKIHQVVILVPFLSSMLIKTSLYSWDSHQVHTTLMLTTSSVQHPLKEQLF